MASTQQTFGNADIRKAHTGMCEKCANSAYLVIVNSGYQNQWYCKTHARESWKQEVQE